MFELGLRVQILESSHGSASQPCSRISKGRMDCCLGEVYHEVGLDYRYWPVQMDWNSVELGSQSEAEPTLMHHTAVLGPSLG